MRARTRSVAERIQLINECRHSGMVVSEWCQQEGIKPNTYWKWVVRLEEKGLIEKEATIPQQIVKPYRPEIVKVVVDRPTGIADALYSTELTCNSELQASTTVSSGAVMEITCGIFSIKVSNQVNSQLLAEAIFHGPTPSLCI